MLVRPYTTATSPFIDPVMTFMAMRLVIVMDTPTALFLFGLVLDVRAFAFIDHSATLGLLVHLMTMGHALAPLVTRKLRSAEQAAEVSSGDAIYHGRRDTL